MKYYPRLDLLTHLLKNWELRPDSASDFREIFGIEPKESAGFLGKIRSGDYSWLPALEILPASALTPALAAYARETGTIYLSEECPEHLVHEALLEEIGHHIDALFNSVETQGDEGALFSATVRGIQLTQDELTAILNEDDSALLHLDGKRIAVECIVSRPVTFPGGGGTPPPVVSPNDTITSAVSFNLATKPNSHGLNLTGPGNLQGAGNSLANYLSAAQNSGNTTLVAGKYSPSSTLIGGSGNDWLTAGSMAGTLSMVGGMGSSTIVAGRGSAKLVGGRKNNLLIAGTGNQSLSGGTNTSSSLYGNTLVGGTGSDTLSSGTGYNTLISGSGTNGGNTLIGGGISNSLIAGLGRDSLTAIAGNSTLIGGTGKDVLRGGTGKNYLVSGSKTATQSNTLIGGSGSNTLIAGSGIDSIAGGDNKNLLLVNAANLSQSSLSGFAAAKVVLSNAVTAQNSLGVSFTNPVIIQDSLFTGMANAGVTNLQTVADLSGTSNAGNAIILGLDAQQVGVHTLVAGSGSDTLSVAAFTSNSVLLNAANSISRASLVGGGTGNDTFWGSKGGLDTMTGASGNDLFVLQNTLFGNIDGGGGSANTIQLNAASVNLRSQSFTNIQNIQTLSLAGGNNLVGSLQGSGITNIIGATGRDTLSANVSGAVQGVTPANVSSITLTTIRGSNTAAGFSVGDVVTGNGLVPGTTITSINTLTSGQITLGLSYPTTALIAVGSEVNAWVNNATLDGSRGQGQTLAGAGTKPTTYFNNAISSIEAANFGLPGELAADTLAISALQHDPFTYIHRAGDYLAAQGSGDMLIASNAPLPDVLYGNILIGDAQGSLTSLLLNQHQVIDNTLISGAYATNTLVGGAGNNLYLLNNILGIDTVSGTPIEATLLPTIVNNSTLQSGSTIQFTGNGLNLTDAAFANVSAGAAQKILTSNGNNLIQIGSNGAQIGIQTIIGGVGSDTFVVPTNYVPSVYFDASRNSSNSSLQGGDGNDTLLAGSGNATLEGGNGNNSLIGGQGSNLIQSGVGNSTLDGGNGISTLQAVGGTNHFVIRNRYDLILNADSTLIPANPDSLQSGVTPEVGIVDSYVNFDPLQGAPEQSLNGPWKFAPATPDNSPSITKSSSFASSDLSSFYNLRDFNLLGNALYGVGNALDNSFTSASANALILGMGGNNTLVAAGANSSLYGDSNSSYVSPDLYAYAPIDTTDQAFVDGVIGVAGNNSLVANGAKSYLDGGAGYNDGLLDGSGSNTLIGTGGNDTVLQTHQADVISLTGGSNKVISSVDLNQIPNNVTDFTLDIVPQTSNSGQVSLAGQRMTAGYAAVGNATGGNTSTYGISIGNAPSVSVPQSELLQVMYGISAGTVYGSSGVSNVNLPLSVGTFSPDPKYPNAQQVALTWTTPLDPNGNSVGQTLGYTVKYRYTDTNGVVSPWLTYVQGTSQDLTGTSTNPRLVVDNLPTTTTDTTGVTHTVASFDFQVTAQERVLPAYTDANGNLIGKPVSLIGGQNNDVLYGGLFNDLGSKTSNTRPVLTNNPINPTDPGLIQTPAPYGNPSSDFTSGLFPTYLEGGLGGNDLLIAPAVNDRSGNTFTSYEYINGVPTPVSYSGLNTLVGGQGSDTFVVSNGGTVLSTQNGIVSTSAYDEVIKYGNETPAGQNNLVISKIPYLTLSDTTVSQGKFINQAQTAFPDEYLAGNRLDNTLSSYDFGNTLLGATGRDSLYGDLGNWTSGSVVLIGGTTYGLDSVGGAIADYSSGLTSSNYRDTDPVPVGVNGPGTADNSQYWIVNGLYDPNRNSDTLVAANGGTSDNGFFATLDGGAGNDSMVGGAENDTFYVSSTYQFADGSYSNVGFATYYQDTTTIRADILVGGSSASGATDGGNDTVVFTGSDVYWSGQAGATTNPLTYILGKGGDSRGGLSISNIILQAGDPVAANAVGTFTTTGNVHKGGFGIPELGSNSLIGNQYNNSLDGGGVGGNKANGAGVGVDTLVGGGGNDTFNLVGYYTGSAVDTLASGIVSSVAIAGNIETDVLNYKSLIQGVDQHATDGDWAVVDVTGNNDFTINLSAGNPYLIGSAPNGFKAGDLHGGAFDPNDFGIYTYAVGKNTAPNLVAEIIGGAAFLGNLGNLTSYTIAANIDGTTTTLTVDGGAGINHLGGDTETIQHIYKGAGTNSDWYKPTSPAVAGSPGPPPTPPVPPIYGGEIGASALVPQANTDVHNFIGTGGFYDLASSGLPSHIRLF